MFYPLFPILFHELVYLTIIGFTDYCVDQDNILENHSVYLHNKIKKIMYIVPGVTGCSDEPYIKEVCGVAMKNGYYPVVLNCCATKDDDME